MMSVKIFGLSLGLILMSACATHQESDATHTAAQPTSLIGSWELVHEEIRIDGKTFPTFDPATRKMMKIFNATHFAFVSNGEERPRFNSYQLTPEQKVVAFDNFGGGAGRYTYAGGYLTEHIEFMNYPNYEGESIRFKISFKGDTMIQEGDYPITKLGLGNADGYLYSVFKRIE